jgi:hypothetical protein
MRRLWHFRLPADPYFRHLVVASNLTKWLIGVGCAYSPGLKIAHVQTVVLPPAQLIIRHMDFCNQKTEGFVIK